MTSKIQEEGRGMRDLANSWIRTHANVWPNFRNFARCIVWVGVIPGSSKKTTTHTYTVLWSCSRPRAPQLNVGHSGCTRRPSKKTTILVTGASPYNLLQHWVGGAGGAAIALLDVDVVVFFEEPGSIIDTGFFKKNNHPHIHGLMELFTPPCPPTQCWAQRVYTTAFKKNNHFSNRGLPL